MIASGASLLEVAKRVGDALGYPSFPNPQGFNKKESMEPQQIELLQGWLDAVKALAPLKAAASLEMVLRKSVIATLFPTPKEGTNTLPLEAGFKLKAVLPIDRKIDITVASSLREELEKMNVKLDNLIKWEPKLDTKAYKELTEEQRQVFDACVTSKPGSPSLEFIEPKESAE